jgi:hypothetical protein
VFKVDALYLRGANGETQVDNTSGDARGEYSLSDRTFVRATLRLPRGKVVAFSP